MVAGWASPAYVPRRWYGTPGMQPGQAAHVRLVEHGLRPRHGRRAVVAPVEAVATARRRGARRPPSRASSRTSGSPARSSPTTCPNTSGRQVTSPVMPRAYGSSSSLAGLYRRPRAGVPGTVRAQPVRRARGDVRARSRSARRARRSVSSTRRSAAPGPVAVEQAQLDRVGVRRRTPRRPRRRPRRPGAATRPAGAGVCAGREWLAHRCSLSHPFTESPSGSRCWPVMPLNGTYEPSPSAHAREQVEQYERSGGAEANTMRGCRSSC